MKHLFATASLLALTSVAHAADYAVVHAGRLLASCATAAPETRKNAGAADDRSMSFKEVMLRLFLLSFVR
jgi:hypothetical protein